MLDLMPFVVHRRPEKSDHGESSTMLVSKPTYQIHAGGWAFRSMFGMIALEFLVLVR